MYKIGDFTFDTQKQVLMIRDKVTKLTTKESELLTLLCAHVNEILERNYALKTIWIDDNYFNARSMDVYITKLRKHLKDDPSIEIINIHGKGYKLIAPNRATPPSNKAVRQRLRRMLCGTDGSISRHGVMVLACSCIHIPNSSKPVHDNTTHRYHKRIRQ